MRRLAVALLLAPLSGCAPRLAIPEADQARLVRELRGKHRFLRAAAFAGPFYGDKSMLLVTDRFHEELDLLESPGGQRIAPPAAERILPPGTPAMIDEIQFPTPLGFASRPLMTPRYEPWVLFHLPGDERPMVLVLSRAASTADDLLAEVDRLLSADDPSPRLKSLAPAQREAVLRKELVEGMTRQAVILSWGSPDKIVVDRPAATEEWIWLGGKRRAFLQSERLLRWSR